MEALQYLYNFFDDINKIILEKLNAPFNHFPSKFSIILKIFYFIFFLNPLHLKHRDEEIRNV